jgi:hypothetical protein
MPTQDSVSYVGDANYRMSRAGRRIVKGTYPPRTRASARGPISLRRPDTDWLWASRTLLEVKQISVDTLIALVRREASSAALLEREPNPLWRHR